MPRNHPVLLLLRQLRLDSIQVQFPLAWLGAECRL